MGLNIVEALIVGAACEVAAKRRIVSPLECTRQEDAALRVLHDGMQKAGFRYNPGLLSSPWGYFYEGMAAVNHLRGRS